MRQRQVYLAPKALFYYSDGTGRDSYIAINNGGLTISKPQGFSTGYGIVDFIST